MSEDTLTVECVPEGPTWEDVRKTLQELARERGEWAGVPLVIDGIPLTVERRYPWQGLQDAQLGDDPPPAELLEGIPKDALISLTASAALALKNKPKFRNMFTCLRRNTQVLLLEHPDGKTRAEKVSLAGGGAKRLKLAVMTLGVAASPAWSAAAEVRALGKLRSHLNKHQFDCYLLTGSFLETSPKSGVTYLFRKLRPTVAMAPDPRPSGDMKILAALCLHPIGYYQGTWAGVMVPTDCVLAHLLLMRGDEHYYWRKANQHCAWEPEAGL